MAMMGDCEWNEIFNWTHFGNEDIEIQYVRTDSLAMLCVNDMWIIPKDVTTEDDGFLDDGNKEFTLENVYRKWI